MFWALLVLWLLYGSRSLAHNVACPVGYKHKKRNNFWPSRQSFAYCSRLQIMQAVPRADDERQIKLPGQIAPNRTIKNDCNKLPIDVIGRCFADTGPLRHDLLMSPDQHLIGFRRDSREAYVLRLKSTTRSGHGSCRMGSHPKCPRSPF